MRWLEVNLTKIKWIKLPTSIFIFHILAREKPKIYLNRNKFTSKHKKLNVWCISIQLFNKLRLNALTKYLILIESLRKIINYSFYTACKTLNENREGFFECEAALCHQLKREIINWFYTLFLTKKWVKFKMFFRIRILFWKLDSSKSYLKFRIWPDPSLNLGFCRSLLHSKNI